MLFIHPIIQFLTIMLFLYVFFLGLQRFRSLHLKQRVMFRWKRHVLLGQITFILLTAGLVGGLLMVNYNWGVLFMTGIHSTVALILIPLFIIGYSTGLYMNTKKGQRKVLPLVHGLNNSIALLLALSQIVSGSLILKTFVLGIY